VVLVYLLMTIADDRHFSYQNENDLVDFIVSEMLDSYLNTKFM